ncbi:hypothetical protein G6M89_07715 [Natronolimnobius sp. AArcel1]|uniref:hypothetical protein n=1 Tax=Natronolimnobius sp. AArcel1 TaxID=1679093 RepID=UPI0013EA4F52|nr:hypothetical protein [Natronolimnobius sp. AArcel1]NGM68898.1 hypothetical protein [Natronolimnobius sp. AArcel1]
MTDSRTTLTRRGAVAATAAGLAGLAGCASSSDDQESPSTETNSSETDTNDSDDSESGVQSEDDIPEISGPETPPEWDHAEFRAWLLDDDSGTGSRRFDYTETIPDGFGDDLPSFFDVSAATVDSHLSQSSTQVFFGAFDVDAMIEDAAAADGFTVTDEYRGYGILEPTSDGPSAAVGSNAIVIGTDYEQRVDARYGEEARLEEADETVAQLFAELPHENTISGQYGSPTGIDIAAEEIILWGVSSPEPMADSMTWVAIFEDDVEVTDDMVSAFEDISSDVSESELDGQVVRVTGAPPDLSE